MLRNYRLNNKQPCFIFRGGRFFVVHQTATATIRFPLPALHLFDDARTVVRYSSKGLPDARGPEEILFRGAEIWSLTNFHEHGLHVCISAAQA